CLSGTRTNVISAIVTWAVGGAQLCNPQSYLHMLDPRKQMLWICGVAGSGKSSIAMSVGRALDDLHMLGSYYAFSATNQASLNPSNLFSTISIHLVKEYPWLQPVLINILADCSARKRESTNPAVQLETFLLPLLNALSSSTSPKHTVLVIDALDE
ncbi:hypothetical protein DL93DRAFT_2034837, partial [Clavulina sp. PMI_390]